MHVLSGKWSNDCEHGFCNFWIFYWNFAFYQTELNGLFCIKWRNLVEDDYRLTSWHNRILFHQPWHSSVCWKILENLKLIECRRQTSTRLIYSQILTLWANILALTRRIVKMAILREDSHEDNMCAWVVRESWNETCRKLQKSKPFKLCELLQIDYCRNSVMNAWRHCHFTIYQHCLCMCMGCLELHGW